MSEHDLDQDVDPTAPGTTEDFDAFFAEEAPAERTRFTLFGKEYVLPDSLPLLFTLQMERVQHSSDGEDVRKMLATLFGADPLDEWAERGMTDRQLGVVLIYSAGNIRNPGSITMARAAELYEEQEAGKDPAPANRAQRRQKPKAKAKQKRSGARS
ncbi:hypothetical protein [Streptomyces sp. KR2]|uniref:hypothetical protein n=1 Tax=Streptomyces sp. KR2 TaxID=1514824 RepID=UPI003F7D5883